MNTRKEYEALAEWIAHRKEFTDEVILSLADFLQTRNERFNRKLFLSHIKKEKNNEPHD